MSFYCLQYQVLFMQSGYKCMNVLFTFNSTNVFLLYMTVTQLNQ